jgi:hypothetical protein
LKLLTRRGLDDLFPTFVRYCGVLLTIALVIASIAGHGVELAAGYVAAAGMVLYKTVREAAQTKPNGDDERWSHLP